MPADRVDAPRTPETATDLYRLLVENMADGSVIVDAHGTVVFANRRMAQMLDVSPAEMQGSPFDRWVGPHDRARIRTLLDPARAKAAHCEATFIAAGGDLVPVDLSAGPLPPGNAVGTYCIVATDMTAYQDAVLNGQSEADRLSRQALLSVIEDQRLTEQALRDERRRLDEIIWGTNVGTWEWNVQTGATVFNERWAEIVGYTLAELHPISIETWGRLCHPDDLKASEAQLRDVFERKRDHYEIEARMRHKTGGWVWVVDRGKVVEWDGDGKPVRMSGTHSDITPRKRAEERIARLATIRNAIVLCQGAIIRSDDENRLLQETCDILIATRHYELIWMGLPQPDEARTVKPVAAAGPHADYAKNLMIHGVEDDYGTGPTGKALRSGQIHIQRDLATAENFRSWAGRADAHGFRCSIAVPGMGKAGVVLLLNVYSPAEDAFDSEETALLSTCANNLALALEHMRTLREKERIGGALARSAFNAVNAIAKTIEKRDPYTSGHQERVANLAVAIARRLGWPEDRIDGLRLGAMIHDIGKIYIPAEILNRPGRLTDGEMTIIRTHPEVGGDILSGVEFPWPIKEMVEQHHERPDGTGYPRGLKGDAILAEAKIIAVADVVEAIAAHRPYRAARGIGTGLEEIRRGRGTTYDAGIVDACLDVIERQGFDWAA